VKERGIAFLAGLWRFLAAIWTLVIVSALAGALGNIIYTFATTGTVTFTNLHSLTSWFTTNLVWIIIVFLVVLALTVCAYVAHRHQVLAMQKQQQAQNEQLVSAVKGVADIGVGMRATLEELKAKPPASSVASQQETTQSAPAWNVPYLRNPFFTGREELLKQLHDNLTQNKAAALTQAQARPEDSAQAQAIHGLGGIGKTQTAVEYAYRYRDDYHAVLWVNAATRDELVTSFVGLATVLNLPEQQEQDQPKIVAAVKQWFTAHDGWLLIVDNADDLAMAGDFLPTGGKGHLLLTTRAHAIGALANGIEVEKLDSQQGMLLLLRRAKVLRLDVSFEEAPLADRTAAAAIVEEMDGLPLALDQAGAFIEETQSSVSDYLQRFRQRQDVLLQRRGGTGKEHPDPVSTTWSLSFERVEQLDPLAAELLRCCAFLAPDAIPEQLIIEGAPELGTLLQPVAENGLLLDEALGTLLRFSLVQRKRDEHTFSIHRLVQAILRGNMDTAKQRQYAEKMVKAVYQAFPDVADYRNWPRCQQYLPHAQVCVDLIDTWKFTFSEAENLLNNLGYYLKQRAQYMEAEPLYQGAIAIGEKTLGPEHPVLATYLSNLATLYSDQGKYGEAEPLLKRAITIGEKTLGPEHPVLATSLNNLANLYSDQGKYGEAEPLLKRAITIGEKTLGPEHPDLATSLNNLATLYSDQGEYAEAERLFQRAIAIGEKTLGPEHPNLAGGLNNLAELYRNQGKYEEAEPLFQRAITIGEKTLGPEHPDLATRLNNLALLYHAQGKYEEAEPLFKRALAIYEQKLGDNHPNTQTIRGNYASLLSDMNKQKG
jgi:tetratricopeptide (TPR) repeat protein